MTRQLRTVTRESLGRPPAGELDFLQALGGPAVIRVPGRDGTRTRAVVTLLHGNEPSGLRAVHHWLGSDATPATDTVLILGAVEPVLASGAFDQRLMPGGLDLNRCFGGNGASDAPSSSTRELAGEILQCIRSVAPEAILDLHNNSGHNPAYGVTPHVGPVEAGSISLFARLAVVYDLRIGSLIEVTASFAPTVAMEVGRAGDAAADTIATSGLARFLDCDVLASAAVPLTLFESPLRVRLAAGASVAFADAPVAGVTLTVSAEADRHNFEVLAAGTQIGWVSEPGDGGLPVTARGADGVDRAGDLFRVRGRRLEISRPVVPIMMTTSAEIAMSDCICYVVPPPDDPFARHSGS